MRKNKLMIIILTIAAILVQGTCVYGASSKGYSEDELNDLTPGFESQDIDKSNYKVNSYKNTFSSAQTSDTSSSKTTTKTKTSAGASDTTNSTGGNVIVSTLASTGNKGDFWGKTSDGKWILIENGAPARGWRMVQGSWYYMNTDGVMQTGWIYDNDTWYYLNSSGDMAYNTYVDGYYLSSDGSLG